MIRKILNILKSKNGATLMELMVGLMVSVIVLGAASLVLTPMMRFFVRSNELAEANKLLDTLSGYMTADINKAKAATVTSIATGDILTIETIYETIEYSVGSVSVDGTVYQFDILMRDSKPVLAEGFYKSKRLEITYSTDGSIKDPFSFTLTIYDRRGHEIGSREYAVNPLGFMDN